jgi:FkbM family methyltransferase
MYNKLIYLLNRKVLILDKKIQRRFGLSIFFLFPLRVITRLFEIFNFESIKKLKNNKKIANYFIDISKIKNNRALNIVSVGVANNIDFDFQLIKNFSVKKLIFVDPNLESKEFVEKNLKNYKLKFNYELKAMSDKKQKNVKIYTAPYNLEPNWSLDNSFQNDKFVYVDTINYKYIVNNYNFNYIDIFKLDAEGFADKILIDLLKNKLLPEQICFELERPYSFLRQADYFRRAYNIKNILKKNYNIYYHTDLKIGMRIELLAVKRNSSY